MLTHSQKTGGFKWDKTIGALAKGIVGQINEVKQYELRVKVILSPARFQVRHATGMVKNEAT